MFMKILFRINKCLILVIIQLDENTMMIQTNQLLDETGGVAIKIFFELKSKMYSFLVADSSEHIKLKSVNKSVVARIINIGYKVVLLINKCLRYSMNRIQSKNHKIGANES